MRKIDISIQQAQRELTRWVSFLSAIEISDSAQINLHQVIRNNDLNGMRLGYALMRFAECFSQLERLENVRNRVYSNSNISMESDVLAVDMWGVYLEDAGLGLNLWREIALQLNSYIDQSAYFGAHQNTMDINENYTEDKPFDYLLDSLIETFQFLKEAAMTADGLRGIDDEGAIWIDQIDSLRDNFNLTMLQISRSAHRLSLESHYQQYLRGEYIYSWLPNASKKNGAYMQYLLEPMNMLIEGEKGMIGSTIRQKFPDSGGTEDAISLLERLQEALRHYGDYQSLSQEILEGMDTDSSLASGGLESLLGSHGGCNVVPSRGQDGQCCDLVLALARGKGKGEQSFENVLRELRRHLIDCKKTKVAVLLTDRWTLEEFKESRMDIEAHVRQGVIFIPVLVSLKGSLSIFSI